MCYYSDSPGHLERESKGREALSCFVMKDYKMLWLSVSGVHLYKHSTELSFISAHKLTLLTALSA